MENTSLVTHYMTLVKNVAYLAANGIEYEERMRSVLSKAAEHLCFLKIADTSKSREMLRQAIEDELSHVHVHHPQYAETLLFALHALDESLAGKQLH